MALIDLRHRAIHLSDQRVPPLHAASGDEGSVIELGLPSDVRVDKDVSFNKISTNSYPPGKAAETQNCHNARRRKSQSLYRSDA